MAKKFRNSKKKRKLNSRIPHKSSVGINVEESGNLSVSFASRLDSQCQLLGCNQGELTNICNRLISVIKVNAQPALVRFCCQHVRKIGHYKRLYDGLSSDINLMEGKFSKPVRIFYYRVRQVIYIRAIRRQHYKN